MKQFDLTSILKDSTKGVQEVLQYLLDNLHSLQKQHNLLASRPEVKGGNNYDSDI